MTRHLFAKSGQLVLAEASFQPLSTLLRLQPFFQQVRQFWFEAIRWMTRQLVTGRSGNWSGARRGEALWCGGGEGQDQIGSGLELQAGRDRNRVALRSGRGGGR